jgi:OsmC subfamily peroxiredoxin
LVTSGTRRKEGQCDEAQADADRLKEGTNPEELLAAAHAGCFAMAVSSQLGKAGLTPQKLEATATVAFEKVGEHFTITKSHLHLLALVPDAKQRYSTPPSKPPKQAAPCPDSSGRKFLSTLGS